MSSVRDADVTAGPGAEPAGRPHPYRNLVVRGLVSTVVAMLATTLVAAIATGAGVAFEVPDGGETIPLSGIAFVTGVFSVVGTLIAAALLRWTARPAPWFVRTAVSLTAISLVPPFLVDAATSTSLALVTLHLVAAAVMIPALARSLRP